MVKIFCNVVNAEMIEVAQMISERQKEIVLIIDPTTTFKIIYEEPKTNNATNE